MQCISTQPGTYSVLAGCLLPAGDSKPHVAAYGGSCTGRPARASPGASQARSGWNPFRAVARNGALLYMAYGNVSVRSARPLSESLTCHRSRQLALLRSVQGARPLRRSAAIPMTLLCHFLPAGHAKHGAAPTGAFDWTQSNQAGAWGNPNKLHRNIENDIPMPCLPVLTLTA